MQCVCHCSIEKEPTQTASGEASHFGLRGFSRGPSDPANITLTSSKSIAGPMQNLGLGQGQPFAKNTIHVARRGLDGEVLRSQYLLHS